MNTESMKHFLDILTDINPASFDLDNLKAIFRDQAWEELPDFLKLAQRVCCFQVPLAGNLGSPKCRQFDSGKALLYRREEDQW